MDHFQNYSLAKSGLDRLPNFCAPSLVNQIDILIEIQYVSLKANKLMCGEV